ncbi:MAG: hypothetical protein OH337_03700 [Candidatus Parvarchaeota archaeon]|nr:hypothetical protein [Candidatus Haiyanarchaeum thermophilum]
MTIRVLVLKASDWSYERVKVFNDATDLLRYLNKYGRWIIYTKKDLVGAVLSTKKNIDLVLKVYDDYVE